MESRLFEHFARDTGLERLAEFEHAARQAPLPRQRLVPALDEQDSPFARDRSTAPTPTSGRDGYRRSDPARG